VAGLADVDRVVGPDDPVRRRPGFVLHPVAEREDVGVGDGVAQAVQDRFRPGQLVRPLGGLVLGGGLRDQDGRGRRGGRGEAGVLAGAGRTVVGRAWAITGDRIITASAPSGLPWFGTGVVVAGRS